FQIPANNASDGINDNYVWEYFGGNASPWSTIDLGNPSTNPNGPLTGNPDGVAFDPTTGDLYLSGDGSRFSLWNRNNATLTNYILQGGNDSGMGVDLAFQQKVKPQDVPEPSSLLSLAIGVGALFGFARRKRK
ncbi:MAG: PEP-CTERM sorting domain-containing protein, partial [Chthonomonadaceae bacterium]|nr:PEP-CTERM sorting domain-containing protein [Chthonomonadaceae bacterium]